MLRGLTRQLTSLAAFAETGLVPGTTRTGIAGKLNSFRPLFFTQQVAHYSCDANFKNHVFNSSPHSLEFTRGGWAPADGVERSFVKRNLLRLFGFYSREATLMRGGQGLFASVTEAIDDKRLMAALDLPDDFQHMHSLLCLHIWLLLVRLRPEGKSGRQLAQMLYDNFQDDVEARVRKAGVKVRLHKQLVELEKQFYGSSMAYDKAIKGDGPEDLAGALHRNVFQKAESKKEAAAVLARYVRREMACLAMTDGTALFGGNIRFSAMSLLPEVAPSIAQAAGSSSAAAEQPAAGGSAAAEQPAGF